MKTQTWTDQQGNNRYKTYVLVDRIELLSNRPQQQNNNQYEPQYQQPQQVANQYEPQYQQQSIRPDGRNVTGGLNYSDIKTDDLPFY